MGAPVALGNMVFVSRQAETTKKPAQGISLGGLEKAVALAVILWHDHAASVPRRVFKEERWPGCRGCFFQLLRPRALWCLTTTASAFLWGRADFLTLVAAAFRPPRELLLEC